MTTFEKTWQVQTVNQSIDNATTLGTRSAYLFRLVEMLTTAGTGAWTVEKSCDGTTASNDDTQNWTSAAKVVFGNCGVPINTGDMNNGTAHSWIELKSPAHFPTTDKYMYLLIDAANYDADTNIGACTIHWGNVTAGTDGTTLRRPTLTPNSWNTWNSWKCPYNTTHNYGSPYQTSNGYNALGGMELTLDYDASHVSYFHGARTSDGYFFCMNTREGAGYVRGGGFILPLDTPRSIAEDPWPIVGAFGACNSAGASLGFFSNPVHDYTNTTNGTTLNSDYSPVYAGALNVRTFGIDGDTQSSQAGQSGYHSNFLQTFGGIDWTISQQDNAGCDIDSKLMALPVWVMGTYSSWGISGVRGRVVDFKLGPTKGAPYVPQATVEPASGAVESVYLGQYWWPLNAVPVI